jgi:hypothetical protein
MGEEGTAKIVRDGILVVDVVEDHEPARMVRVG